MLRRLFLVAAALALTAAAAFSCSTAAISGGTGGTGATAGTGSGTGGAAAATSSSSGFTTSAGGAGGGCVGTATKANPLPLDIFVMLDQSGSMNDPAGNNLSRWQTVKAAITSFVQQPDVAGIGMGIQYFGLPQPSVLGCTAFSCTADADCKNGCTLCGPGGVCHSPWNPDVDTCDAVEYAWAEVPIQPLPGAGPAILSSLGMHAPGTNTPTSPALAGAIDYARAWATAHAGHITVVALATDGEPGECDADLNHIDAIAAAGFAGTPSIKTFVIGVGPSLQALDDIAAAGGTTTAFHVDVNTMATQQFLDAMNTIRGASLQCKYQIPPAPMGMTVDLTLVNVEHLPGMGGPKATIPHVQNPAACPATGDGWYYDDNVSPTEIVMCPTTCAVLTKDSKGEVDIVLGCKTILK